MGNSANNEVEKEMQSKPQDKKAVPPVQKVKEVTMLKQAFSLFGGHIGGIIIALILCFSLSGLMTANVWGLLASQVLIIMAFAIPVYSTMWEFGHKDKNRANYGHITLDKYRGFKVALIANSPFFLMSLLIILSKFGLFYNIIIIFKLVNAEIWPLINLIQPKAFLSDYTYWQIFLTALLPLIPVGIEGVSYIFGLNDYSPLAKIIYKKKKPATKKKGPPTIKSQY